MARSPNFGRRLRKLDQSERKQTDSPFSLGDLMLNPSTMRRRLGLSILHAETTTVRAVIGCSRKAGY
jgi:hypothetical protein